MRVSLFVFKYIKRRLCIADVTANNNLQFFRINLINQLQKLATASRTKSLYLSYQYYAGIENGQEWHLIALLIECIIIRSL